jgi:hypothetical protein
MKRRVSTRRRRNPRQYDSEDSVPSAAQPPSKKQQQRKRLKVDPSFIIDRNSPPVEEDEHIRHLDQSGALSHVVGSQSILSQELNDCIKIMSSSSSSQKTLLEHDYDQPLLNANSASLLTSEELEEEQFQAQKTTPSIVKEEEMEEPPAMSSSQLSFLIGAARALESDNEDDDDDNEDDDSYESHDNEEEILTNVVPVKHGQKVHHNRKPTPRKPPTKTRATVAVSSRPPLATKPLPSTKNPAATKKSSPTKTRGKTTSKPPTPANKTMSPSAAKKTPTKAPQVSRKEIKKMEKVAQQNQARSLAQQAASLAAQAIASPEVSKQLLLSMVFVRTNPRSPPATWPAKGSTIPEGFFWATYPPLETTLKQHMRRYYELSVKKCQSKEQQAFNNDMVTIVRVEASQYGWSFSTKFSDKGLRDRVRCYFKTHIQNAKKRLRTMLMNPTKRANTKALINHLDMIQTYSQNEKEASKSSETGAIPAVERQEETLAETSMSDCEPTTNDSQSSEPDLDPDTQDAVQQVVRTIALF